MNSPVCLFTVVYPGCEPYLKRFFQSVQGQDYKEFELLILNDGLENLGEYAAGLNYSIHEFSVEGTIAQIRNKGLNILMDQPFEKIVFADADDYFSGSRILQATKALDEVDIYVNDLTVVDHKGKIIQADYLSHRLKNGYKVKTDFIMQKNILGLGNSSVRKSALQDIQIPESTIAVDWIIFTDMLLRNCSAVFKNDSQTYYRQHESNIAGFKKVTEENMKHALEVQMQNATYFSPASEPHKELLTKLQEVHSYLAENEPNIKTYSDKVGKLLPDNPFWWEEIKTLDQVSI